MTTPIATLNNLTCDHCGELDSQTVTESKRWHTGKKHRVRVDTLCTCDTPHVYVGFVAVDADIVITEDEKVPF